jgi:exodeoxyribonuclease X
MKVLAIDTETHAIKDPQAVEIAWLELDAPADKRQRFSSLYRPSVPIAFGAMAAHHITDEDVAVAPPAGSFALPAGVQYIVGHNVDFDWSVIGRPDVRRICTLALSRHLWPDIDSHSLGAVMWAKFGARCRDFRWHRADADVSHVAALIPLIREASGVSTWGELWQISESARVPTKMPFGKHEGMLISEVPTDYCQWLLKKPDVDEYLRAALCKRIADEVEQKERKA